MKIAVIDDEARALSMMRIFLTDLGQKDAAFFQRPAEAMTYLREHPIDLIFVDMEMPEMDGMTLVRQLQNEGNAPEVVFATAHPQFALAAWEVEAVDYLLKPFGKDQVMRALRRAQKRAAADSAVGHECAYAQCFPTFDFWVNGKPVVFSNKKSKELLAYLIHMEGAWVGIDQITFALFEDSDESAAKNYYRQILHRLRRTLYQAGLDNLIEGTYGKVRVRRDSFSCDYYRFLAGETNLFRGFYLEEYSWAETTKGILARQEQ